MFPSRTCSAFWVRFHALPPEVREIARKNYRLWKENPFHPSLHFKRVAKPNWSVRVGDRYRAVRRFVAGAFLWEWIGTHAEYDHQF